MPTVTQYQNQLVAFAKAQLGKPYVYGAAGPNAWDSSGLTMMAAQSIGVEMAHGSAEQFNVPQAPRVKGALEPGDFVYFRGGELVPPRPGHTGIYTGVVSGAYTMIDAYDEQYGVRYNTFIPTVTNGHDGLSYYGAIRPALWGKVVPPPSEPTLYLATPYMHSSAVKLCQQRLVAHGQGEALKPGGVDGIFGPRTKLAVEYFQMAEEITVDGIVGNQTWKALMA
jgi:peptidoglycan hydrolase-like protein with peptidoglycan-binding domain